MFLGKLFCLCVRQQLIDTFSLTSYIYDKKLTTFLHKEKQHMYITACGITWQGKLDDPILTNIVFLLKKLVWPGFGLNRAEGLSRPNTRELAFLFHSSIRFTKTQFSDFHANSLCPTPVWCTLPMTIQHSTSNHECLINCWCTVSRVKSTQDFNYDRS